LFLNGTGSFLTLEHFDQLQAKGHSAAGRGAGDQLPVGAGRICLDLCTGATALTTGIAHASLALRDPQITQNRRAGTDGGGILAVFMGKADGIHGLAAGPDGSNTTQATGQHHHFQVCQIHFLRCNIGNHTNAMTAHHSFAVQANSQHRNARPAKQIDGRNGFGFLETGAQKHIYHSYSSRQAAT